MNPDPYKPVKCPDCGTWWRGYEHRCAPQSSVRPWVRPENTIWVYSTTCVGGGSGGVSVTMPPGSMLVNGSGDEEPPDPQRAGALV